MRRAGCLVLLVATLTAAGPVTAGMTREPVQELVASNDVFAFNLFGFFEIQLPSWVVAGSSRRGQQLTEREGSLPSQMAGVFFMALTFTLVSFTCTVGFIGIVLAEALACGHGPGRMMATSTTRS